MILFIANFMCCLASALCVSFFSPKLRTAAQRPARSVLHQCPLIRLWALGSAVPSSRVRDGPRLRPTSIGCRSQESTPTTPGQLFWSSCWLLRWQLLYSEEYVWLTSIYLSYRAVSLIKTCDLKASLNILYWVWHKNCLQKLLLYLRVKSLQILMYLQVHYL